MARAVTPVPGGTVVLNETTNVAATYDGNVTTPLNLTSTQVSVIGQNASVFAVGRTAANPALQVNTNTALSVTGVAITAAVAGGGVALSVISSGANESMTFAALGTGIVQVNSSSAGNVAFQVIDASGNSRPMFRVIPPAAAVNGLSVTGSATGVAVALSVAGADTNIPLAIDALGTGTLTLQGTATGTITLGRATTINGNTSIVTSTFTVSGANSVIATIGRQGATNPAFQVDTSSATGVTGWKVTAAPAASGAALAVISSAVAENGTIDALGTGTLTLQGTATGAITLQRATTINAATTINGNTSVVSATFTLSGANSAVMTVGRQGATNPAFQVDTSSGTGVTGVKVTAAPVASGTAIAVISSGTDEALTVDAKGAGTIGIGTVSTGTITLGRATTITTGGLTVSAGGITVTGASTITGTLGGVTTLTATTLAGTLSTAAQPNITSVGTLTGLAVSGTVTITNATATALTVGRQGATNPVLQVDASTATVVTGVLIKGAAASGGVAVSVISSAAAENLTIDALGTGTITLAGTSTGVVSIKQNLAVSPGTVTVTSSSATALTVGRQGATNPVLQVDASTATVVTGVAITGAAAAGGVTIAAISSGATETLNLNSKGASGTVVVNAAATVTNGGGLQVGAPTGGDKGAGTVNLQSVPYVNGTKLADWSEIAAGTLNAVGSVDLASLSGFKRYMLVLTLDDPNGGAAMSLQVNGNATANYNAESLDVLAAVVAGHQDNATTAASLSAGATISGYGTLVLYVTHYGSGSHPISFVWQLSFGGNYYAGGGYLNVLVASITEILVTWTTTINVAGTYMLYGSTAVA